MDGPTGDKSPTFEEGPIVTQSHDHRHEITPVPEQPQNVQGIPPYLPCDTPSTNSFPLPN